MSKYVDDMFNAFSKLEDISYSLDNCGRSLFAVGLERAARDVRTAAREIRKQQKIMHDAVSQDINDQFKTAQTMSRTIVESAMAGIELGRVQERIETCPSPQE